MTGHEAWSVIAPILAAHSVYDPKSSKMGLNVIDQAYLNAIDHAYVIAYSALCEYDEKRKEKK